MAGPIRPDQLGALFDRLGGLLVLYARQWADRAGAEDIVQDAFVALSRQAETPDHPEAWLYRVVRNRALTAARGASRRRSREAVASAREPWFASADDRLDADEATALLAELPADQREAIVAKLWGGLTFDDVARLQGCSAATAFRRYRDGLARLQERMERPCSRPTT